MIAAGGGLVAALERHGYWGLGLAVLLESAGVPVPGEAALLAASFAAAHGTLSLPVVIAVAAVAAVTGDNLGYALGRRLGHGWLQRHGHRFLLTPSRLERVDRFFARFGAPAVALARFVAGVRVVAAFAAGMSRMRWRTFLLYNVLGAILWATVTGLGGFAFGRGWGALAHRIGPTGTVILAILPLALLTAWVFWEFRRQARAADARGMLRRMVLQWAWILCVCLGAVATFAKVSEDVAEHETAPFDEPVRHWVLTHQASVSHAFFSLVTWLGATAVLLPLVLTGAAWLWKRRGRRPAVAMLAASAAAGASVFVLKHLFIRARPAGVLLLHPRLEYSFPSSHTAAATAVALTAAYVLRRERLVPRGIWAAAVLIPVLVGLSRVYLGVHWATDVVGGWSVGLLIATVAATLYERLDPEPGAAAPEAAGDPPSAPVAGTSPPRETVEAP